ncbi:ABC transporter substrate-binding protein [Paenibacillus sp. PAMC21692]|uniref:ABC transporter substrate-binding protein n=1 Tax=Paenibacillus sp. PAMC21692 TaxID=2762320 RepID=UPI00164CE015|nr:ABC transporter substrate-binding protein [Paenibacillus sp. PAMC21692]QNK55288.1 carbohydrate ABC transporter substrate-binding protein [Paenibacillus sp. PAMC21692]
MNIQLRGITWNHSRGYVSVAATAQRFMELHPGVDIIWEKRSLQAFADYPIHVLADQYDLLIIDHPWAGFAADKGILVPLEKFLPTEFMADQAANSVGLSHVSYQFDGRQYALAVDAATPIATYRPDLFERDGLELPTTWEELLALARTGKVAFAGIPIDLLMQFYMLCATQGEEPFAGTEQVASENMGLHVLEQLRELSGYCTKEMFGWNPIRVYEEMCTRDSLYYCPFAYGYSNYTRKGYAARLLLSTDMVSIGEHGPLRSTLGGTGIAVSSKSKHLDIALEYAKFTASPEVQKTIYVESGGQPGHRAAWLDEEVNRRTNQYFINTLPALDRAYMRPRYSGYFHFQDRAGDVVRDYIMHGGNPLQVLQQLDRLYRESLEERK